jgi:hypothetical protein
MPRRPRLAKTNHHILTLENGCVGLAPPNDLHTGDSAHRAGHQARDMGTRRPAAGREKGHGLSTKGRLCPQIRMRTQRRGSSGGNIYVCLKEKTGIGLYIMLGWMAL